MAKVLLMGPDRERTAGIRTLLRQDGHQVSLLRQIDGWRGQDPQLGGHDNFSSEAFVLKVTAGDFYDSDAAAPGQDPPGSVPRSIITKSVPSYSTIDELSWSENASTELGHVGHEVVSLRGNRTGSLFLMDPDGNAELYNGTTGAWNLTATIPQELTLREGFTLSPLPTALEQRLTAIWAHITLWNHNRPGLPRSA